MQKLSLSDTQLYVVAFIAFRIKCNNTVIIVNPLYTSLPSTGETNAITL